LKPFTNYPLVAIVTAALPESSREIIRNAGIQVKEITSLNPVSGRHELNKGQERFADTWTKLRVFELVEYEVG
jgi:alpha-N-acetylglucosamine transferase